MSFLSRRSVIIALATACLVLVAGVFPTQLGAVFPGGLCPGIRLPDMPFGPTASRLNAFKDCVGESGLEAYRQFSLVWDSLFPLFYSLLFAGLAHRLLRNDRKTIVYKASLLFSFGAGFLDLLENYFIRQTLQKSNFTEIYFPLIFNILKWSFAFIGLVILTGILIQRSTLCARNGKKTF